MAEINIGILNIRTDGNGNFFKIDNFHLKDFADGEFRVLGTASIDFDPIFAAIRDIDYDGWISTDEESGADLLEAMEHCLHFMKDGLGVS